MLTQRSGEWATSLGAHRTHDPIDMAGTATRPGPAPADNGRWRHAGCRPTLTCVADRDVTFVRTDVYGAITKLGGPWGEARVSQVIRQVMKGKRGYFAVFVDRRQLHLVEGADSKSMRLESEGGRPLEELPTANAYLIAEQRALHAALVSAWLLRFVVGTAAAVTGIVDSNLDIALRWSLAAMAMFTFFHIFIDMVWYFVHRERPPGSRPLAAPQSGSGSAASLITPTAAAVIAFVTAIGKNITTTTKVGVGSLATAILLGIALAGLQGADPLSRVARVILVVMVNALFFAFAFGLVCLGVSLILEG